MKKEISAVNRIIKVPEKKYYLIKIMAFFEVF